MTQMESMMAPQSGYYFFTKMAAAAAINCRITLSPKVVQTPQGGPINQLLRSIQLPPRNLHYARYYRQNGGWTSRIHISDQKWRQQSTKRLWKTRRNAETSSMMSMSWRAYLLEEYSDRSDLACAHAVVWRTLLRFPAWCVIWHSWKICSKCWDQERG